jgi:hypothetical protein
MGNGFAAGTVKRGHRHGHDTDTDTATSINFLKNDIVQCNHKCRVGYRYT